MGILLKNSSGVVSNVSMPGIAKAYYKDSAGNVALVWNAAPPAGLTIGDLPVGALLKFIIDGTFENHILIQHGNPNTVHASVNAAYDVSFNDSVTLLRQNIWENRIWHTPNMNKYGLSTIHADLNSIYYNLIEESVRNIIRQVKIPYGIGSNAVNDGANGLPAYIWLLAGRELNFGTGSSYLTMDGFPLAYFANPIGSINTWRIAYLDGVAADWWTRTTHYSNALSAWHIMKSGTTGYAGTSSPKGIRPALVLPANTPVSSVPDADGAYTILAA